MIMNCPFCKHELVDGQTNGGENANLQKVDGNPGCEKCGMFDRIEGSELCRDCFNDTTKGAMRCPSCGEYFNIEPDHEPDDSMDGDSASALASAGMGTDEDYEHNLIDDMNDGEFGED